MTWKKLAFMIRIQDNSQDPRMRTELGQIRIAIRDANTSSTPRVSSLPLRTYTCALFLSFPLHISSLCLSDPWSRTPWPPRAFWFISYSSTHSVQSNFPWKHSDWQAGVRCPASGPGSKTKRGLPCPLVSDCRAALPNNIMGDTHMSHCLFISSRHSKDVPRNRWD